MLAVPYVFLFVHLRFYALGYCFGLYLPQLEMAFLLGSYFGPLSSGVETGRVVREVVWCKVK